VNTDWIIAGAIVLVSAILLVKFRFTNTFQSLVFSFAYGWSAFVALHCWGLSVQALSRLDLPYLTEGQQAVIAYWGAFIIATLPSRALTTYWLRSYATGFPVLVNSLMHGLCSVLFVAGFACLALMSAALVLPPSKAPEDMVQWVTVTGRQIPVQAYLIVAAGISSTTATQARYERLPVVVRSMFPIGGQTPTPSSGERGTKPPPRRS